MKCKELKKLSKKALIKRLKTVQSENWTLLGQIVRKDEEIGELSAYNLVIDEMFSQTVQQNLAKIDLLEAKLAQYQAQFGELNEPSDDNTKTHKNGDKLKDKVKSHKTNLPTRSKNEH